MDRLTPWQQYQTDLQRDDFSYDPAQEQAVLALQQVYDDLLTAQSASGGHWFKLKQQLGLVKLPPMQGLYLWGGVGRGKTYLMDAFYEALPLAGKLREHFHHFMLRVHRELDRLKGQQDPLEVIAKQMAEQYQIICFDEFFVADITDAMLLGTLFEALFEHGVVLVATSNIVPDELYRNGLQRARFLPAIALIKQHCRVLNVDSGVDYRLRTLQQAEIYHYPLDKQADANLLHYFTCLVPDTQSFPDATEQAESTEAIQGVSASALTIDGRRLPVRRQANGVLLVTFRALCDGPRSQRDYMALARQYHTVLLSGVEQMGAQSTGDDIARRFLALVDEFYERHVKLIMSAQVPLAQIYTTGQLSFEFRRCRSRLTEMQSHDYLALEHLP
ncbi:cell division protein ZapE [Shewanella sp. NFH-SH190041]|uniref:cell division protein ZapE n=1 Tax=Shewanella sp. NFH-SH190041 TaxID=2950245 RepID=UPI0021C3949B|nr:cell division protein ZapE [Shewanella sp. NFH-SH190041]